MTLRTLLRDLNEFDPNIRVWIEGSTLHLGKNYLYTLPTKQERDIERLYEEQADIEEK